MDNIWECDPSGWLGYNDRLLHGILQRLIEGDIKDTESPIVSVMRKTVMQRLRNSHFHSALLCCATELVAHAYHV